MSEVKIGKHLLETITAALYADPIVVFREYVQNAIDSSISNNVDDFAVNIIVDLSNDVIRIIDNGAGIRRDEFLDRMKFVAISQKGNSQIGFRGIGRLSGLSFCDQLIFQNKHADSDEIQIITWENNKYQEMLESDDEIELSQVISQMTTYSVQKEESNEHFFVVELQGLSQELKNCILQEKKKPGRQRKKIIGDCPSETFIAKLSELLPIPYSNDFQVADKIRDEYFKVFNCPLSNYEFVVMLNKIQLFKNYHNDDIRDENLYFIPISLDVGEDKRKVIGLIWISFNYLFQAYGARSGIAVRSKNMLLSGSPVLADEATKSINSIISHSDYIAAERDVIGEFLIKTDQLKDNSKRDWFRTDANTVQLREIIFEFMSNMQYYRRAASKYYNAQVDKKTEKMKKDVISAFERFVTGGDVDKVTLALTQSDIPTTTNNVEPNIQNTNNTIDINYDNVGLIDEKDIIADGAELINFTSNQRDFYAKLMGFLYKYYVNIGEEKTYHAVKRYIIEKLNKNEIE